MSRPKTSKVRFEIRLPLYYNDGTEIEPEKYEETKNEVYEKFGAFTVLAVTQGGWRGPDTDEIYIEPSGGFFVDVDKERLDEAIEFFKQYKGILKTRFKQEEIYIVGYELYVI